MQLIRLFLRVAGPVSMRLPFAYAPARGPSMTSTMGRPGNPVAAASRSVPGNAIGERLIGVPGR